MEEEQIQQQREHLISKLERNLTCHHNLELSLSLCCLIGGLNEDLLASPTFNPNYLK